MNDASTTPATGTDGYDQAFRALHDSSLVRKLWAQAMGEQYPEVVDPRVDQLDQLDALLFVAKRRPG
jgi:hypothetical protein